MEGDEEERKRFLAERDRIDDVILDYAKFQNSRVFERQGRVSARAASIISFLSLVQALSFLLVKDNEALVMVGWVHSDHILFVVLICFYMSLLIAVFTLRIRRGRQLVEPRKLFDEIEVGHITSASAMKRAVTSMLDQVSCDSDNRTSIDARLLVWAHLFLALGMGGVLCWIVFRIFFFGQDS